MFPSVSNGTIVEDKSLLPDFITDFCATNPERVFAHIIDVEKDGSLDGTPVTARQMLEDARRAANHISYAMGSCGSTPIKVSILARSGYDYLVNFIGTGLNHWIPVLISTRNSLDAIVELVRTSESKCLIVDDLHTTIGESARKQVENLKIVTLYLTATTTNNALDNQAAPVLEVKPKTNVDEPALYLHSSGTTGHPKLIPIPHRTFLRRLHRLGEVKYPGRPSLAPVPLFHTMGVLAVLGLPMSGGLFALIMESKKPVTGEVMVRVMHKYPGAVSLMAPATLLDMLQLGDVAVDGLKKAHRVMFAGASLSREVGDQLVSYGVKLMTLFGTTETGGLARSDLPSDDPKDWEYIRFRESPDIILAPVEDATNVVQLHVREGEFLTPDLVDPHDPYGYTSGDLFEEHPTKKDLWRHAGRKSSVTVLSNGEKTDNRQLESLLENDDLISIAVVFGSGRFQNGVIIVPASNASFTDRHAFVDAIWKTVENANTIIPQHSRLVRPLVLVADPSKGISLTDKGTVRRAATLELYKDEIEAAYYALENDVPSSCAALPHLEDEAAVIRFVRSAVFDVMKKHIEDNEDMFNKGMDSLSALTLRSSLLPIFRVSKPGSDVPRNIIYHYPTITRLAGYIRATRDDNDRDRHDSVDSMMDHLVGTFTAGVTKVTTTADEFIASDDGRTVLLTGSTGTFGIQILATLLQDPSVERIVCVNRHSPSRDVVSRHRSQMDTPELLDAYGYKIVFLAMHLPHGELGLNDDELEMIRTSVTDIIHCAWDINFNHPLEHFKTHLGGVKHLAQIALSSKRQSTPRFVFISSIASVGNYQEEFIPEEALSDPTLPLEQGYGRSKYVAEQILCQISAKTGMPVTIVRVGQLSGSTVTGCWNRNEYMFLLLQTSIAIGKIPDWLPDVRWMPTDVAARALVDVMVFESSDNSTQSEATVYHLENPATTSGEDIVKWLVDLSGGSLVPVTFDVWLGAISASKSASAPDSLKTAERLYDFFKTWLDKGSAPRKKKALSTQKTMSVSTAAQCASVDRELLAKYYQFAARNLHA